MEVREVLEGMLGILHEKEWIKGNLYKVGDHPRDLGVWPEEEVQGVCLEGAFNLTLKGFSHKEWLRLRDPVHHAVMNAAADSCPEKCQYWMRAMFQFNDAGPVTREDVILAVKTAISRLEEP